MVLTNLKRRTACIVRVCLMGMLPVVKLHRMYGNGILTVARLGSPNEKKQQEISHIKEQVFGYSYCSKWRGAAIGLC